MISCKAGVAQALEHGVAAAGVEFIAPALGPGVGGVGAFAVDRSGRLVDVLVGVIDVDHMIAGLGQVLGNGLGDPRRGVADEDEPLYLIGVMLQGLLSK